MKKLLWILPIVAIFAIAYFLYGKKHIMGERSHHAILYLQPYDNLTQNEIEKLKADLDNRLGEILSEDFEVIVLPNKHLSDTFLGETKKKYRIDKIINSLKEDADNDNIYIGITHRDICRDYKNGVKDWGVLGSSVADNHACVVSDHRLKHKKRDLWKVVTHEFIHTYYGYPHCPKDSAHCLMKDAKGKADFYNKHDLCGYCKKKFCIFAQKYD